MLLCCRKNPLNNDYFATQGGISAKQSFWSKGWMEQVKTQLRVDPTAPRCVPWSCVLCLLNIMHIRKWTCILPEMDALAGARSISRRVRSMLTYCTRQIA
jgi:hypothetical protein